MNLKELGGKKEKKKKNWEIQHSWDVAALLRKPINISQMILNI